MAYNRTCRLRRLIWTLDTGYPATGEEGSDLVKSQLLAVLMDRSSQNVGRLTLTVAIVLKSRMKILSVLTAGFHQSSGLWLYLLACHSNAVTDNAPLDLVRFPSGR
jgi:hypothetical protein